MRTQFAHQYMMLVKTVVRPSIIEGLGLFADQDIPQGTPVWQFTPGFDLLVDPRKLTDLSPAARDQFLKYAYVSKKSGKYVLCFDDARFFNHDANPNVSCTYSAHAVGEEDICLACRQIPKDEEMTCDYREFDSALPKDSFQTDSTRHNLWDMVQVVAPAASARTPVLTEFIESTARCPAAFETTRISGKFRIMGGYPWFTE